MFLKRTGLVILVVAVIAGSAIVLYFAFGRSKPVSPPTPIIRDEMTKQLQAEASAADLAAFKADYGKIRGFDLRNLYEQWIDRIGANGIEGVVQEVHPTCHDEGHDLGKVIYSRLHDIGASLATCDAMCNSGCMHGVFMEAFAPDMPSMPTTVPGVTMAPHVEAKDILAKARTACAADGSYSVGDCIHGIGHAFMFLSDYDIPTAIGYCDQLDDVAERYYCATGAYMEFVGRAPGAPFRDKSFFYPCDLSPYPSACFRYKIAQNIDAYYQNGGTFGNLTANCLKLPHDAMLGCLHGVGNSHSVFVTSGKATLDQICGGDHDQKYVCIEGMMERMSRYYPDEAKTICAAEPAGWAKDLCDADISHGLYDMEKSFELYPR